ncbi:hypothetical protein D3C87_2038290 [compost metagenome]
MIRNVSVSVQIIRELHLKVVVLILIVQVDLTKVVVLILIVLEGIILREIIKIAQVVVQV